MPEAAVSGERGKEAQLLAPSSEATSGDSNARVAARFYLFVGEGGMAKRRQTAQSFLFMHAECMKVLFALHSH